MAKEARKADISEIEGYCDYLLKRDQQPSAKVYRERLLAFVKWLEKNAPGRNLNTFTINDVSIYISTFTSPRTSKLFKSAVLGYMGYRIGKLPPDHPTTYIEMQRRSQIRDIHTKRITREYGKIALEPEELKTFLNVIERSGQDDLVYAMCVVLAYFGARPIEIEQHLRTAKINWTDKSMILKTAKTGEQRFLCWGNEVAPYLVLVYRALPLRQPGEWLTSHLYTWQKKPENRLFDNLSVSARTFRRTFQTQQRLMGVPDIFIDYVLGHESKSAIGDVYTDFSSPRFMEKVRFMMTDPSAHYMLKYGVI